MADIAVTVGDHLKLHVARLLEITLHINGSVAKGRRRFRAGGGDGFEQAVPILGDLHPATAAAGRGLDQHGEADLLGGLHGLLVSGDAAVGAGHDGDTGVLRRSLGGDLVAHHADVVRARADEGQAVGLDDLRKARVLRQKAVARMHGLGAGDLAGGHDGRDVEIALRRLRRADAHALVGEADVHGACVSFGVDRDRGDAHLLAGPMDPQRDLTAVSDQYLVEHSGRPIR